MWRLSPVVVVCRKHDGATYVASTHDVLSKHCLQQSLCVATSPATFAAVPSWLPVFFWKVQFVAAVGLNGPFGDGDGDGGDGGRVPVHPGTPQIG